MATNPTGVVMIPLGKGKQLRWVFSVDAICALEDHLDRGVIEITAEIMSWLPPSRMVDGKPVALPETPEQTAARNGRVRMGFCRAVFWAGLQEYHPDHTIAMAGEVMREVGGLIPALEIIVKGIGAAFPDADADQPASPPKANRRARRRARAVG